jgi:hypothetical protein
MFAIAVGKDAVVIKSEAVTIVMLNDCCAFCAGEPLSVTRRIKVETPPAKGVPLIVLPLRDSPAGKLPMTDQV